MFDRILTCDIRWNENPRIALSSSATKFITKLLQVDMEKRLTAKNVVIALERWVLMRRGGSEISLHSTILSAIHLLLRANLVSKRCKYTYLYGNYVITNSYSYYFLGTVIQFVCIRTIH